MNALDETSDGEVARGITEGGERAAPLEAELCRRFLNRARLYGLRHLRFDVTLAEDLAQEVMVIVLEALRRGRVEDPERISHFVLGTCRNVAHSLRRRKKRSEELGRRLSASWGELVTPPWELVESRRVEECYKSLSEREAKLLVLLYQEGATGAEAGEALSMTPGNVRVLHHRALARLRECVEKP
jgi:RNA polymerase sigma-70 factor (ECF subfamily)